MQLTPLATPAPQRGFSLIELLVTLVIVSVGMLGLAKLQAAATAEGKVSRTRSIMAYQAESVASAMRANGGYWGSATPPTISIAASAAGGTITNTDMTSPRADGCAAACTPAEVAVTELKVWADAFGNQFPTATANIGCSASAGKPTTCDITLQWPERYVAINRSTAPSASDVVPMGTLVVHVQP